jgi:tetratricopeptide (TPR) repeat protein
MVGRNADNRIEPECWPAINPSFHFTKDQKFFAIGSCFAENIARRLHLDGYNVHGATDGEGEPRRRYTPPAVAQEIAWAHRIHARDDEPTDADILPLLLEMAPGRWTDLWATPETGAPRTLEEMIARRRRLYAYFRGAFEADVVIVTLGLIEAWRDEVSGSYVEFDTAWARREDRARFSFERLSFEQCKKHVRGTLDLLRDGSRRILLTTSPVVLARTFTGDDIIVANSHSKSVLRAVAGELSDEFPDVDYFPSYEIATVTRRPEVWEDDLVHVNPGFVGRIMQHVTSAYVPGSADDEKTRLLHMVNLVQAGQYREAQAIYEQLAAAAEDTGDLSVHAAIMRLAFHRGETERAIRHAMRFDPDDSPLYINHLDWMFDAARVLAASDGHKERAAEVRRRLVDLALRRPELLLQPFGNIDHAGDALAMGEFLDLIREADVNHPGLISKVCAKLHDLGDTDEALRLADRQLGRTPDDGLMLARKVRLLLAMDRPRDAAAALARLAEAEPENMWAHLTLARTLARAGRHAEALTAADFGLARTPDEPQLLAVKARILMKLRRREEAVLFAQRALDHAAGEPNAIREAARVLGIAELAAS